MGIPGRDAQNTDAVNHNRLGQVSSFKMLLKTDLFPHPDPEFLVCYRLRGQWHFVLKVLIVISFFHRIKSSYSIQAIRSEERLM